MLLKRKKTDKRRYYHKQENKLKYQIANYLNYQYPEVDFVFSWDHVNLTIGQATQLKRLKSIETSWPDLFIAEPKILYHGLFLETKRNIDELFTKHGKIRKDKHLQEQIKTLEALYAKNYAVYIVYDFDIAKMIIDKYLRFNMLIKPNF